MTDPATPSPPRPGDWAETRTEREASTRSVVLLLTGCVWVVAAVLVGLAAVAERRSATGSGVGATVRVAAALVWGLAIAAVIGAAAWWRRRDELVLTKLGLRCSVAGLLGHRALFVLPWQEIVDAAAGQQGGEEWLFVTTQQGVRYAPWVFEGTATSWAAEIRRHAGRVREAVAPSADEMGGPDDFAELGYATGTVRRRFAWAAPLGACLLLAAATGVPVSSWAVSHGSAVALLALGVGIALSPFGVLGVGRLLAARRSSRLVAARVRRSRAGGARDFVAARAAGAASAVGTRGAEALWRGLVRAVEPVRGPGGAPCAAYLVRRPTAQDTYAHASAAGRLELETADGERIALAAGAWEVLDSLDPTALDAEGHVSDGMEVIACGPVTVLPGAAGSYRSTAPRVEVAPGWLAPVDGRLSDARVRTRDGSGVVVHAAMVIAGLALAALASDVYLHGTPVGLLERHGLETADRAGGGQP